MYAKGKPPAIKWHVKGVGYDSIEMLPAGFSNNRDAGYHALQLRRMRDIANGRDPL